jgi:RNA polymerase sigma factor (sigma-70 family)
VTHASAADLDDTAIAALTSAGRESYDGFEAFYVANHARLERAVILSLGSTEVGQDAVAEAFARALKRWEQVGGFSNPQGWVFRVAVNWARSRRRRARREVSPEEFSRIVVSDAPTDDDIHNDVVVTEALARLGFEHRVVVVARYYLDWSEADLAAALDVPAGTVKSRTSRALKQLAEILEDER